MSTPVRCEIADHVAVVTLSNPGRRNAVSLEMLDALREVVPGVAADTDVRAVVLTGDGDAFCSGADFTALAGLSQRTGGGGVNASHEAIRQLYAGLAVIESLPQPTVAAVNGAAVGAGLGLALMCDVRVVSRDAKISAPFARLGIPTGLGISRLLPRAVGFEAAAELLFTGRLIRGDEAGALGLARHVVDRDEVLTKAMALAAEIAEGAPLALRYIKRSLYEANPTDLARVRELESLGQALLSQTADAQEGIAAALQKRKPDFRGR